MEKEKILEITTKEKIEEIYSRILKSKEDLLTSMENAQETEKLIREEIAKISNRYKKDGITLDLKSVPTSLVKSSIETIITEKNTLQEKFEKQEEFISIINNGEFPKEMIDSYIQKNELVKEQKENIKETIENIKGEVEIEGEIIIDAISMIVDKKIKEKKEDAGEGTTEKDNTETLKIIQSIQQILNSR